MKQLDLFETEEDDAFLEEAEKFIEELEREIARLEEQEKFIEENNGFNWAKEFPQLCDDNGNWVGFDAVVGNPPYIDIRNIKENSKKYYNITYPEQKNNFDLYSLFIQRSLQLIKNNGFLSFIVPKPILYNSTFKPIRKIIGTVIFPVIILILIYMKILNHIRHIMLICSYMPYMVQKIYHLKIYTTKYFNSFYFCKYFFYF